MHSFSRPVAALLAAIAVGPWSAAASAQTRTASGAQPRAAERAPAAQGARSGGNSNRVQYEAPADTAEAASRAAGHVAPAAKSPGQRQALAPAAAQDLAPAAPFTLTETQQQLLDQILIKWEQQSNKVKTFVCKFKRWEIDPAFGPKNFDYTMTDADGVIKYRAPDRGDFEISKSIKYDPPKAAYISDADGVQRWMCDGQAIFEWDYKTKQLKVRPLPAELRGKSISDGPLPFVFGAKAEELKRRYWLRDVTPKDQIGQMIWLDARPKYQQDAANFQRATLILNEKTFLPEALQIFPPGIAPVEGKPQANTAFQFYSPSVNNPLDKLAGEFLPPITPLGWKKLVVEDPAAPPPPAGDPSQVRRPRAPVERK